MRLLTTVILQIAVLGTLALQAQPLRWEQAGGPRSAVIGDALWLGSRLFVATADGVFVSDDDAATWTRHALMGRRTNALALDSSGALLVASEVGLFVSSDSGKRFAVEAFADTVVGDLAVTPEGTIVASVHPVDSASGEPGTPVVFMGTVDGGWRRIESVDLGRAPMAFPSRVAVGGGAIFAGAGGVVWASRDRGETWSVAIGRPYIIGNAPCDESNSYALQAIAADAEGALYVAWDVSDAERVSPDGTRTLLDTLGSVNGFVVDPDGSIVASDSRGLWRSTDRGETWIWWKTLGRSLGVWSDGGRRFLVPDAWGQRHRFHVSLDAAQWDERESSLVLGGVPILRVVERTALLIDSGRTSYLSTDNGDSWTVSSFGVRFSGRSASGDTYLINYDSTDLPFKGHFLEHRRPGEVYGERRAIPASPRFFAVASDGTLILVPRSEVSDCRLVHAQPFVSLNGGRSWQRTNLGHVHPTVFTEDSDGTMYLAMAPVDGRFSEESAVTTGFYISTDGLYWVRRQDMLSGIVTIATHGKSAIITGHADGTVLRTLSGAFNWQFARGLPSRGIHSIVIDRAGTAYATVADSGVYRSTDMGLNWSGVNDGLWNRHVTTLALDSTGVLYVGTESAGIFRTAESVLSAPSDRPGESVALSVAPMPASSQAMLRISLPRPMTVRLVVESAGDGRRVLTTQHDLAAGESAHPLDCTALPSGLYAVRVIGQGFEATTRLVIVR